MVVAETPIDDDSSRRRSCQEESVSSMILMESRSSNCTIMSEDSIPADAEITEMESMNGDFTDDADEYTPQQTVSGFPCEYCGKKVKTKNGLHKHKKRYHDSERRLLMKFLCSEGCNTGFPHLNLLRNHYNAKHNLPPNQISAQFPSLEAFEAWKESEEQTTCSKFVVKDRRLAGQKGRTRIMYWCHRSGESSEAKDKTKPKTPRTAAKTGIICTAAINVFININGTVDMSYFPEHWGHERDAQYLYLSKEQRQEIAQRLTDGVSPDDIVRSCQSSDNIRLKKVTRSTIYRICRDFEIPWVSSKRCGRVDKMSDAFQSAEELEEYDDYSRKSDEEFDEGKETLVEHLTLNQKQATECLEEITAMVLNGAVLTRSDMDTLKALERKLKQQFTKLEVPVDCVVIVDTDVPTQSSTFEGATVTNPSGQPPRDLNVAIINYDA